MLGRLLLVGQVRLLAINETESVGPAMARYFASKLWQGEAHFMQIDAHTWFADEWDAQAIAALLRASATLRLGFEFLGNLLKANLASLLFSIGIDASFQTESNSALFAEYFSIILSTLLSLAIFAFLAIIDLHERHT